PVAVWPPEEPQQKSFRTEDRALNPVRALRAENRIFTSQFHQIAVERGNVRVHTPLFVIQFASFECHSIVRQAHGKFGTRTGDAWKLIQKFSSSFLDQRS